MDKVEIENLLNWLANNDLTYDVVDNRSIQRQQHKFTITPNKDKDYHDYTATSDDLLNNNKIENINIQVPNDYAKNIYAILHEAGHYVGYRDRENRRELVADLIICGFIRTLFEYIINRSNDRQQKLDTILLANLNGLHKDEFDFLWKTIIDNGLYAKLNDGIHIINEKIDKEVDNAEESLYLNRISAQMLIALTITVVDISERDAELSELFHMYADDSFPGLCERINHICDCISEPTADCFTVVVTNMGAETYLKWILSAEWEYWKYKCSHSRFDIRGFLDYATNPVIRTRVLSVYYAIRKGSKQKKNNKLVCHQHLGFGRICTFILRIIYKKEYHKLTDDILYFDVAQKTPKLEEQELLQKVLDPVIYIAKYIKSIYEKNQDLLRNHPEMREKLREMRIFR